MTEMPVTVSGGRAYVTDGALAYAGHWVHDEPMEDHTHTFVEVAVVTGGEGVHRSLAGRQQLGVGDVIFLRPGVWHGYETSHLELYNCGFSAELLHRELAWTREDPLLGYLLWTGPLAMERRGMLTTTLDPEVLQDCEVHLDALDRLRLRPLGLYRSDIISHLTLVLGHLARAVATDRDRPEEPTGPTHPAVVQAMRLLESRLTHPWTLTELASELHLSPSYLLRLFKSSTGMPPMAYLSRRRVETAAELLLHTSQPMTQICRSVGWPDQNYFARRFKAHFGLTATTYRRRFADSARQLRTLRSTRTPARKRRTPPSNGQPARGRQVSGTASG
jgi:AraC family transcriptional regulator, L-rhamnose operon transcriptional activator RhaR